MQGATCPSCGNLIEASGHHCPASGADVSAAHQHRIRVRKKKRGRGWSQTSRPKLVAILIVLAIALVTAWMLLDALTRKPRNNPDAGELRRIPLITVQTFDS